MKKLFLVCLVAIFGLTNAQEAEAPAAGLQGAWWAMGTLQYTDSENSQIAPGVYDDVSSFVIMPIAGTFISPTVTVGAGIGYQNVKVGDGDGVGTFIIQPLARKYWGVAENLYIFGQAAVPMTFNDDVNTFGFALAPGVDYFLSSQFTIEAAIGAVSYTNTSPDVGDSYGTTKVGFDTTDLTIGLKYIF